MGDVATPLPAPAEGASIADVMKPKMATKTAEGVVAEFAGKGMRLGTSVMKTARRKGVGAEEKSTGRSVKALPPLARSSPTVCETPLSHNGSTKVILTVSETENRRQKRTPVAVQPTEIVRVASMAESVVDSWTPDATPTLTAKNAVFNTAPYGGDVDPEQETLQLARPISRRGMLPVFDSTATYADEATADETDKFDVANPLRESSTSARGPLNRRDSIMNFSGEVAETYAEDEMTGGRGAFATTNPAYNSGRHSVLSTVHSAVSSSVVDLGAPINLDDLRCGQGTNDNTDTVEEVFKTVSLFETEGLSQGPVKVSPTGASLATPSTPSHNASETTEDGEAFDTDDITDGSTDGATLSPPAPSSVAHSLSSDVTTLGHTTEYENQETLYTSADDEEAGNYPTRPLDEPQRGLAPDSVYGIVNELSAAQGSPLGTPAILRNGTGHCMDGISDNRISPFDADNARLWTIAAAASARADALAAGTRQGSMASTSSLALESRSWSRASSQLSNPERNSWFRNSLRRLGLMKGGVMIASSRVLPRIPQPDSGAPPGEHSLSLKPSSNDPEDYFYDKEKAPAFGTDGILGKTPLVSPMPGGDEDTADDTSSTSAAESPGGVATARVEVESDIEEGATRPTHAVAPGVATQARVATEVASGTQAVVSEGDMVLPCAPSDTEKILYQDTWRFWLISCALVSFAALSTGMWLFTIVTPAFYWFGLPAVFLIFYLAFHYFGVAVWGEDFSPEAHAELVRKSEQEGYQPSIDVFLPVCREPPYLLANTWTYVSALDYPGVNVYVLDDGANDEVKALAASFGFHYIRRDNAPELKKAGNLRYAFARTSGDAIAIFDADFCPRPDFLKETVPYLGQDSSVGIVQTPQYFRHREEQTWIERGAGVTQEFFYRLVQVNQDKFRASVCVGSCGLYRRKALEPFGGMAAIAHSEDMYTGFKMTEHGYSIKYVPLNLAMGACPDEPQTFFMQQYRWCMGSATLVTTKDFWKANISAHHKLCFLNGMLYYVATAALVFVAPLPILLLIWVRADGVLWYHSGFTLPSIVFAAIIMPLWSKQRYGMACHRVKIIQCYAHMYAIKDRMMGRSAPWVPSGAGASTKKAASATYKSSVRLMLGWNIIVTLLIVGGSAWRMTEHTWYHFMPAIALAIGSLFLNLSTLVY